MRTRGVTLVELLVVVGIITVIALGSFLLLGNRRGDTDLESVRVRIVTLLREAQQRAIAEDDDSPWGVHFDASENDRGSVSLFASSSFSGAPVIEQFRLPARVKLATSTVPDPGGLDVLFARETGEVATSTSLTVYLIAPPRTSSTITISTLGVVTFD